MSAPQKEKPRLVAEGIKQKQSRSDTTTMPGRLKSTGTAAQRERIIEALRRSPKTTDELRAMGIYQTSARIHELRRMGYEIDTALYDGWSADGYSHARMARYELTGEPKAANREKVQSDCTPAPRKAESDSIGHRRSARGVVYGAR